MAKVDVLIPIYNNAEYISETLDSVFGQTFQDFKVIIVDDGSTDQSREIVNKYANKYLNKIHYIYQNNTGPAAARNNGLRAANAEYIALLDGDDLWMPTKLEKQIQQLDNNQQAGFNYTDNDFIDEKGQLLENYVRKVKLISGDVLLEFFTDFFLMMPSIVFRRDCLERVAFFNESLKVGEDFDFLLKLTKYYHADVVKEKLWRRRVYQQSLSRGNYERAATNDINTLLRFVNENPDFYEKNKRAVNKRIADYYFTLAYRHLERGKNIKAFNCLIKSLQFETSLKVFKNMFICLIPYQLRKRLKGK